MSTFQGTGIFIGGISTNTSVIKRFVNTKVLFNLDKRTNRMTFRNADTNEVMFVTSPVLCSEWNDASGKQCLSFVTYTGRNYKVLI